MLSITNLSVTEQKRVLIECFSEHFLPSEICALVGNNGTGKTTMLKTVAGLLTPQGTINIDGCDLSTLSAPQRSLKLAFLPQQSPDHPYCSALNRIAHGLLPTFGYDFLIDDQAQLLIEKMADSLNIKHLLNKPLSHMSGGELRLVHLAKCLINPSVKLLLLDEPSVFLDFTQQEILLECLKAQAKLGKTIIFSSHDHYFIERLAHRVLKIHQGALIAQP